MSLLPREQHVLNEIERTLSATDRPLAGWLSGRSRWRHPKLLAAVLYLLAPALLLAGVLNRVMALLVAGIVLAVLTPVAAWLLLLRPRRDSGVVRDAMDDL